MRRLPIYATPAALCCIAVYLYLQFFIVPCLPLAPSSDHIIFLVDGRRMLDGQVLYRDFFQFLFPGTQFVYFLLFQLFGVRAWVPNAALVLLGAGFFWTSLVVSRKLFTGIAAFLPGLLFVAIPFRNSALGAGGHHWFSALAVMGALAVLMDSRTVRRCAVAGLLCGVAAWFNQTRGPLALAAFVLFLLWEKRRNRETWRWWLRRIAPMAAAFVLTLAALCRYFVFAAGWKAFADCTVVFLWKYFSAFPPNRFSQYGADFPAPGPGFSLTAAGTWVLIEALVPWIYVLFFWRAWRGRSAPEPWDRLMLVGMVGICLFAGVASSAMNYRLCTVSLPALIILVWFLARPGRLSRVALSFVAIGVAMLMVAETVSIQTRRHVTWQLPIGREASFHPDESDELNWFLQHQSPHGFLLAFPEWNFRLGLRNPTPVDYVSTSDFTRPEQVREVIAGLEAHRARWVSWQSDLDQFHGPGDHLNPLREYLNAHYHLVQSFEDGAELVLERNGR